MHTQLDEHLADEFPSLETLVPPPPLADDVDDAPPPDPRTKLLQEAAAFQRALILRCSHIGGHAYAGNVIIYTPNGTSIWSASSGFPP